MSVNYYPVNLLLKNRKCLVAGGGKVAERKIQRLLDCGARVVLVSPKATEALRSLAQKGRITFLRRKFRANDMRGAYLVIAATGDRKINSALFSASRRRNILVNVVDNPAECDFIMPAVLKRGDLTISVSTNGASPLLARKIRRDLEKMFGAEYARLLRIMRKIRDGTLGEIKSSKLRKKVFQKMIQPEMIEAIKRKSEKEVKVKLERILTQILH